MILRIKRESRMAYGARSIQIAVDGNVVSTLRNNEETIVNLPEGQHYISFQIGKKTMACASVKANDDSTAFLSCWASAQGGIEFYCADPCVRKEMDSSGKRNGIDALNVLFLIVAIVFVLWLIFPLQIGFVLFPIH